MNGGSNTDRTLAPVRPDAGRRVRSVHLIKRLRSVRPDAERQLPVDSGKVPEKGICDRTRPFSTDQTMGVHRLVEYTKVPVRDIYDRTCSVSGDRTLTASGQHLNTGVRVELTGASGQHDRSVRSPRRGT